MGFTELCNISIQMHTLRKPVGTKQRASPFGFHSSRFHCMPITSGVVKIGKQTRRGCVSGEGNA
jgi:hypothetical protein